MAGAGHGCAPEVYTLPRRGVLGTDLSASAPHPLAVTAGEGCGEMWRAWGGVNTPTGEMRLCCRHRLGQSS